MEVDGRRRLIKMGNGAQGRRRRSIDGRNWEKDDIGERKTSEKEGHRG